jgi:hypothetical protein
MWAMQRVEITVKKRIDFNWSEWFEGMTIQHTDQDETILTGTVVDQAALYGLLTKLRNLGLSLMSVTSTDVPDNTEAAPVKDAHE